MHGILQEGDLFSGLVYKSVFHDTTFGQTWKTSFRFLWFKIKQKTIRQKRKNRAKFSGFLPVL